MVSTITGNELIGLFESIEVNDEKVSDLKGQEKMLNADSTEQIKTSAKEWEVKPTDLKAAYKHWVKAKNAEDPNDADEDLYSLIAMIDTQLTADNEEATK